MTKSLHFRNFIYLNVGFAAICSIAYSFLLIDFSDMREFMLFFFPGCAALLTLKLLSKKRNIKFSSIFSKFKCESFIPNSNYESIRLENGMYVGVDTTHGTMLLVSIYENIYKGMMLSQFSGYHCEGGKMTIKFNDINFPFFVMYPGNEAKNMEFAHKLDALISHSYSPTSAPTTDFGAYVNQVALAH